MKITEQMIATERGELFVKCWKPDSVREETPLLLIHDSLGSVEQWRSFPEELARRIARPVIAYDRAGFGRSYARQALPDNDFITREASDYWPLIKAGLSIQSFRVLGHSVGGAMALHLAATDPDCVGVVSMAAPAYVEDRTLQGITDAQRGFATPAQFEKLARWHGDKAQWTLDAWTKVWHRPSFRDWRLTSLPQVTCPALIIHGCKDEFGSVAIPRWIAEQVSGEVQLQLIDDCGHMPQVTHKAFLLNLLETFIAR